MTILFLIALALTFRPTPNVLGCGLIGFVPNRKNTANLDWVKLIMAYNAFRGTDSSGIYMNDEITKGVGKEADIRSFMAANKIEYDSSCKNKTIIAHARKSSYGATNIANAHPFTYENEKGRSIILAHNGTINNCYDLGPKYDVDLKGCDVDSQKLAKIIIEKGYDVLNHYKGNAALLFAYDDEPNTLYVFKGASKSFSSDKELNEERPLFFIRNSEGVYISSMREALDACSNKDIEVFTFAPNTVCKISNNTIETVYTANRETVNCFTPAAATSTTPRTHSTTPRTGEPAGSGIDEPPTYPKSIRVTSLTAYDEMSFNKVPGRYMVNRLYHLAGRYYCIPDEARGKEVLKHSDYIAPFIDGIDEFLVDGEVYVEKAASYNKNMPPSVSKHPSCKNSMNYVTMYFYKGVLIRKDKTDRFKEKLLKRLNYMTNMFEKIKQLSAYSVHPITFLYSEVNKLKATEFKYYFGGSISKAGSHAPAFSFRRYVYDAGGHLITISSQYVNDPIINVPKNFTVNAPAVIERNINVGLQKVHTFQDPLSGIDMYRFVKVQDKEEEEAVLDEAFEGAANVYYYSEYDDRLLIHGRDIKKRAVILAVFSIIAGPYTSMSMEQLEERADYYIKESDGSSMGLCMYMNNSLPTIKFEDFIIEAVIELHNEKKADRGQSLTQA